jgi:hypothetical protein
MIFIHAPDHVLKLSILWRQPSNDLVRTARRATRQLRMKEYCLTDLKFVRGHRSLHYHRLRFWGGADEEVSRITSWRWLASPDCRSDILPDQRMADAVLRFGLSTASGRERRAGPPRRRKFGGVGANTCVVALEVASKVS